MGDGVFLFGGEVGHGAGLIGEEENGVVAEAAIAAGGLGDDAFASGREVFGREVGTGEGDVAVEAGGSLLFGGVFEAVEDDRHFFGEGSFFASEPFAVDAEFAGEGVNLEAGVVGKAPFAGGLAGGFSFDGGVFGVGGAGFFGLGGVGVIGEGFDGELGEFMGEDGEHFSGFFVVMGGNN